MAGLATRTVDTGWFLPLFWLSPLPVQLVDTVIGAVRRRNITTIPERITN